MGTSPQADGRPNIVREYVCHGAPSIEASTPCCQRRATSTGSVSSRCPHLERVDDGQRAVSGGSPAPIVTIGHSCNRTKQLRGPMQDP
jgi:hypothetical protein